MEAAKRERDVAARELEDAIRQASRYLDGTNPSQRLIQQRISKINEREDRLRRCHYTYCDKAKISVEDDEQMNYLSVKTDAAIDCTDKCTIFIDDIENELKFSVVTATKEERILEKEILRHQIESEVNVEEKFALDLMIKLDDILAMEITEDVMNLAKVYDEKLCESVDNLNKSWKLLISAYDSTEELDRITNDKSGMKTSFQKTHSRAVVVIENFYADRQRAKEALEERPSDDVNLGRLSPASMSTSNPASLMVKPEKMKLPYFSGNIRNYARFKRNFKEIILPFYSDPVQQVYVIKENCLKGQAKFLVENIEDMEAIWMRLDDKYGDKIDLVDVVIKDLENLPSMKIHDDQKFIQLVDIIEKGLLDLEAIDAKQEIANAYTVKMIETKISRQMYLSWLKVEDKIGELDSDKSRFERMFGFLEKERRYRMRLMKRSPEVTGEKVVLTNLKKHANTQNSYGSRNDGSKMTTIQKCLVHTNATHFTRKCRIFLDKSPEERAALVKETKGCYLCLSTGHLGKPCPFKEKWGPCKFTNCGKFHSHLLHDAEHKGLLMCVDSKNSTVLSASSTPSNVIIESDGKLDSDVLLLIQDIPTDNGNVLSFFDNGSTMSLVSGSYIRRKHMKGIKVSYELITVGGVVSTHHTHLHNITLIDSEGVTHIIQAFEINDICGTLKDIDVSTVIHLFRHLNKDDVERKSGDIELLIGMRHVDIHPVPIEEAEGLILFSSKFGTNRLLGGTHNMLNGKGCSGKNASITAHAQIRNTRVMFDKRLDAGIDFFTSEDFGIKLLPKCDRCTNCKKCTYEIHQMSKIEQRELNIIENNLTLDPIQQRWITQYPYKCNPFILENNKAQVKGILVNTEKRLSKSEDTCIKYKEQFNDFITRKVFRELDDEEIKEYKGPIFYVPHHEVYKEDSSSTPVRLVINSSLQFKGRSFNDILMKGPNTLNELFGVQLRFRSYEIALVCDISKMYHSIKTTGMERHLRRVLWRDVDPSQPIKTYGTEVMMFGDRPAAAIATVALHKTATLYKEIDEQAANKIKGDSYVDDIVTGADNLELAESLKVGITEILKKGGFKPKGFVMSGDISDEPLSLLGSGDMGRVLGIGWDPCEDDFKIKVRINFSKRYKKGKVADDLDYEDIPSIINSTITKRLLLSFVNSCYEPLGLFSPITVQMKILMRKLYNRENPLDWDDDIPDEMKKEWVDVIRKVKECETVTFKRCIKPLTAVGNPELIICNDGSEQALCAAAYIRWKCSDGFRCYLWTAKSRVTPIKKLSIPRIEMQSAVMAVRLSESIKRNSIWEFSNIYHIIDSLCTLATLRKNTSALREFMGNRVSEILDTTKVSQWYHVKSKENIADLGTRSNASLADISPNSEWQNGSKWMSSPIHLWPVTQDLEDVKVPEEEVLPTRICAHVNMLEFPIDYRKYIGRSYQFIINVTARLLHIARVKSFKDNEITVDDIQKAESFILRYSMQTTEKMLEQGKLRSLRPERNKDDVIVLRSRAIEGLRIHYDVDEFPILTSDNPVSHLWIKKIHNEDHGGITKVVAKSRRKYWIIRARKLAAKIKRMCYKCRLRDKILAQQIMAPLPTSRMIMSPTFNEISLDLFGPFEIKDTVKQRSRKKVWGLVVNCIVTRAVHIDVTEDYGTDTFLQVLRKFVSLRGCPTIIHCDKGSQLQAAWEDFKSWSVTRNIKLKTTPAEGQHQNGLSEILIKSIKKSLSHTIGNNVLTFSGLQMVFFEVASIINSRPVGVISGSDPTCPDPITPNHLILGRSTSDVATGPFDNTRNVNKRYEFQMRLVADWWSKWYESVLPSLVPSYKWMQRHRNVKIGDICLIQYKKDVKSTYRLGKVIEVQSSADGLVRKVILQYKLPNETIYRLVDRPIHGIAVIVPVEEQVERNTVNHVHCSGDETSLNPNANEFYPVA